MHTVELTYYYMTRDEDGCLYLFYQPCIDWGDGEVIGDDLPLNVTVAHSMDEIEWLASEMDLDPIHGDPAKCRMLPGHTLIGHRLVKKGMGPA
jgi:hypothetical protein